VTAALSAAGYTDAHATLPVEERITTDSGAAIDLFFGRDIAFSEGGVGPREVWDALSDHLPVWTRLLLG
jgi:hypothetical protein